MAEASGEEMRRRMQSDAGFIAALDQSRGSTPKALNAYGIEHWADEAEMLALVHRMRARIMTSPRFDGARVLGAILFQDTLDGEVGGAPTSEYLWREKRILPFLKVDAGLADEADRVQMMKPIPDLDERLPAARAKSVFGTKMRSVIKGAEPDAIGAVVAQQFEYAQQIAAQGLVPIIEPEVDIGAEDKAQCERLLQSALREHLDRAGGPVMLKLTLPESENLYREFCAHPRVLRVAALSGGYSRAESNARLAANEGVIASFSRALTEGLRADLDDAAFDERLDEAVASIAEASAT